MGKYTKVPSNEPQMQGKPDSNVINRLTRSVVEMFMWSIVIVLFPIMGWWCVKKIKTDHVLVQHRLGEKPTIKTPGLTVVLPGIDTVAYVDMRPRNIVLPQARYHSKDGILLDAGLVLEYHVTDAVTCVSEVLDIEESVKLAAQTALPTILAQNTSDMIQCSLKIIQYAVVKNMNNVAYAWGIDVTEAQITPFKFSSPPLSKQGEGGVTGIVNFIQKIAGYNQLPPKEDFVMTDLHKMLGQFMTRSLCDKINAVILLKLTGENGGTCLLDFKTGNCVLNPQTCHPETTIEVNVENFLTMVNKKIGIIKALKSGDLTLTGDKEIALRLRHIL